jgi:hypothetical protein
MFTSDRFALGASHSIAQVGKYASCLTVVVSATFFD